MYVGHIVDGVECPTLFTGLDDLQYSFNGRLVNHNSNANAGNMQTIGHQAHGVGSVEKGSAEHAECLVPFEGRKD